MIFTALAAASPQSLRPTLVSDPLAPLQNAGSAAKGRKRRERERQDLRVLVGAPLTRLSTLNGLDLSLYSSEVLPRLIAEISSCKDDLAQQHLFDSLIQVRWTGQREGDDDSEE